MNEKIEHLKIVLTGGGTGGHIFPALTVANEVQEIADENKVEVEFLYIGSLFGVEKQLVKERGIEYKGIFTGKLRRYFDWRNITDGFLIMAGFSQSLVFLAAQKPDVIFAKGGFVTVPVVLAARILKIPVIAHESDSVMGLSNKIILPFVKRMALGFPPDVYKKMPVAKTIFTGTPVRPEAVTSDLSREELFERYHLYRGRKIILVLGGSQGAKAINEIVDDTLDELLEEYVVIHSAGKLDYQFFKERHGNMSERLKANYLLFDSIGKELGRFIVHSDLLITRGGANTLAEIVAAKKVSLIIPLPSAASDHQRKNALFFQKNGLAQMLDENLYEKADFLSEVGEMLNNKSISKAIVEKMENIFPANAAVEIAKEIFVIIRQQKREQVVLEVEE